MEEQADRMANDRFDHPGVALENKERTELLLNKIAELPENQRIAFTLHRLEGLSYKEISQIMEMSLSAVEALLFRAKKNLRKKLEHYYQKKMI